MNELALFAGVGGGILGGKLLGWRTVCAVEIDPYARCILIQRQNDGILEPFPIWDDVCTFDGTAWRGIVDVVSGGFPCQDISTANPKGKGLEGERSGLWREMSRIIGEVRPRYALIENSPNLINKGLDKVLCDLAHLGYNAEWGIVSADDAIWAQATPKIHHERKRIWILAENCNIACQRQQKQQSSLSEKPEIKISQSRGWWSSEPSLGRVVDGVSHRVDQLKGLGNAQVPAVVKLAWELLTENKETKIHGE